MAKRKTHECYVEDLQNANPHLHILNRYINNRTKVKVQDDRCKHTWNVMPSTPLRGIGCPKCYGYISEEEFRDNLSHEMQKRTILN